MSLKRILVSSLIGFAIMLLLAALGFSVFSIYQTEYWAGFVKIFGSLGLCLVVLALLIVATVIYNYWRDKR